jgi:hypothetical protein
MLTMYVITWILDRVEDDKNQGFLSVKTFPEGSGEEPVAL